MFSAILFANLFEIMLAVIFFKSDCCSGSYYAFYSRPSISLAFRLPSPFAIRLAFDFTFLLRNLSGSTIKELFMPIGLVMGREDPQ